MPVRTTLAATALAATSVLAGAGTAAAGGGNAQGAAVNGPGNGSPAPVIAPVLVPTAKCNDVVASHAVLNAALGNPCAAPGQPGATT
ncbi:chaplin family protein [Streptomyces sp. NPDC048172]|uniref:chaplin family protein n=1 Tax=Streptomyces sp. NPDC048172 TaxID=3365505 RepID=UPI00371299A8